MATNPIVSKDSNLGKFLHEHPVLSIIAAVGSIAGICACLIMVFTLVTGSFSLPELFERNLQAQIIGDWIDNEGNTWSFYENGTCQINGNIPVQGTYVLEENGTLRFTAQGLFFFAGSQIYQVTISGDKMVMSDENGVYLNRVN